MLVEKRRVEEVRRGEGRRRVRRMRWADIVLGLLDWCCGVGELLCWGEGVVVGESAMGM